MNSSMQYTVNKPNKLHVDCMLLFDLDLVDL